MNETEHSLTPCKVCHIWHCPVCGCHKSLWITEEAS